MRAMIPLAMALCLPFGLAGQRRGSGPCLAEGYWPPLPPAQPETANQVVVILGSSTAAGVGASRPSASWAAGLEQRLGAHGIRVVNLSIPGSSTQDSLARFESDAIPHRPAFVFLTTSLVNEGFLANSAEALDRYRARTQELIDRVRQAGAVPVLMTMYPHNRYTPAEIDLLGRWTQTAESAGWPVLNFMSPLSDAEGRWLRGLTLDGVHPLDAGHRQMLEAIPDSLLPELLRERQDVPESSLNASWRAPEEGEPAYPLRVQLDRPASSWTAAAFVLDPALTEEVDYIEAEGDRPIRLARRMGKVELWVGGELLWTRAAPAAGWRHLAVSYQALTGRIRVAIDGAAWGDVAGPDDATFRSIGFAGRCRGCNVAHLLAYRANLHPHELGALAGKALQRRSLDFSATLNTAPDQLDGINLARTLTALEAFGLWALDSERFPPACPPVDDPADGTGGTKR